MATTSRTTTFTPLHGRILVRRVEESETVRGGIIIPDSAKEKPQEGEVIAVGKGRSNEEGKVFCLDVKAGERLWQQHTPCQETGQFQSCADGNESEQPPTERERIAV